MANSLWRVAVAGLAIAFSAALCVHAQTPPGPGERAQVTRIAGTIKNIQAGTITLTPDTGVEATAQLSSTTKILRVEPGQKDLSQAVTVSLSSLQPGDRVLVRGQASPDGRAIVALAVIVMKQADVAAKREHDRQDWQKRGIGGLVDSVDPAKGTVTITSGGLGTTKKIVIHTSKNTILRRYAPSSIKFDDAKPAPLDQIKAGDQLRARGTRNEDGSELAADEIVSGSFRNIAGTITAIDTSANTITVKDAIAKNTVVVKIALDSQMKKLPPEMAQRIAMRLKASSDESAPQNTSAEVPNPGRAPNAGTQWPRGPGSPTEHANGSPDLDRLLARLPNSAVSDLQKGDAVMIVSTLGESAGQVTAITLLAGVEPILTSAPNKNASAILSPWTLGGNAGEGEGGPQ